MHEAIEAFGRDQSFDSEEIMTAYKKEVSSKNETSFLYAVCASQRILENADLGCAEGEQDKEQSDHAKHGNCELGRFAGLLWAVQLKCFVNIDGGGRNEENGNVDPIG